MAKNKERYEAVKRMILEGGTIRGVSENAHVSRSVVQRLRNELTESGQLDRNNSKTPDKWTSREKFMSVVAASGMNEYEKGEYCRKHGIFSEHLDTWTAACMEANESTSESAKELRVLLKEELSRSKGLERELKRKEKALAEAAALLVLRKKAAAIWGENEED
jgi:transposase